MIDRNLGFFSEEKQQRLRDAKIAIFGVGGLGGVLAEILARSGVGEIRIVDHDHFEPTNLNRQIGCTRATLGMNKVEALRERLLSINPELRIITSLTVDPNNLVSFLQNCNSAVLAIDKALPCIWISRTCMRLSIPLIEGWAIPFLNVRVFDDSTPSLESVYALPTESFSDAELSSLSPEETKRLDIKILGSLSELPNILKYTAVRLGALQG